MTAQIPSYLQKIVPGAKVPAGLPGMQWPWMDTLREKALTRFLEKGLPRPTQEEWRYTPLFHVEKTAYEPKGMEEANAHHLVPLVPHALARMVFVDGRFRPELSELKAPTGLTLSTLRQRMLQDDASIRYAFPEREEGDSWHELNLALFEDGPLLEVAAEFSAAAPIEIIHFFSDTPSPRTFHSRPLIDVGENARVTFVESFIGTGQAPALISSLAHILVHKNAQCDHVLINQLGRQTTFLLHEQVAVQQDGHYAGTLLHAGSGITRHTFTASMEDTRARTTLRAVNIAHTSRHIDLVTDMRHSAPHTQSQQDIRALAAADGVCIFQGGILVERAAQKTDARQDHRGLLLSERAEINTKPALEIYADDVKCGHGTTCGALDDNHLFYLRSRGLPRKDAETMLLTAFMAELFDALADEDLRSLLLESAVEACHG